MRRLGSIGPQRGRLDMSTDRNVWLDWTALVKQTVARFARGNIAAQEGRILFPQELDRAREHVRVVTHKWKERAQRAQRR